MPERNMTTLKLGVIYLLAFVTCIGGRGRTTTPESFALTVEVDDVTGR